MFDNLMLFIAVITVGGLWADIRFQLRSVKADVNTIKKELGISCKD